MRFHLAVVLTLLTLGSFVAGCSNGGAPSQDNAAVQVDISQMFISIKNHSGIPLTEVTASIVPPTRTTVYTKYVGRLENAESRDLMLGDFSGRDGTPFSLRVVKPKSVEIKGIGADGKTYEVSLPWKL